MIRVKCHRCGDRRNVSDDLIGRTVLCQTCNTRLDVEEPPPPPTRSAGFRCPYCGTGHPPRARFQVSTGGWVLFVILLLFCFPLCFIGLLLQESYRVCDDCGIRLG